MDVPMGLKEFPGTFPPVILHFGSNIGNGNLCIEVPLIGQCRHLFPNPHPIPVHICQKPNFNLAELSLYGEIHNICVTEDIEKQQMYYTEIDDPMKGIFVLNSHIEEYEYHQRVDNFFYNLHTSSRTA
jgi:hypothetical protein